MLTAEQVQTDAVSNYLDTQFSGLWNSHNNTFDSVIWKEETPSDFNEVAFNTEVARLQAEYDNAQYARDRAEAYPSIEDQLDKIYHEGIDGWKTTIQAVKDEYPKP